MPKLGTVGLKGASGRSYEFSVYPRADLFKPLGAVYLLAKRIPQPEGSGDYTWIYVAETEDISRRPFDELHKTCIDDHEANSVCLLIEESAAARVKIEADLRRALDPPCNRA